jgi:putative resolvase
MPVLFRRLLTGTIPVDVASAVTGGARVARWCARRNGKRVGLRRILSDPSATVIVVERRDRPARFGVEYLGAALAARGQRIAVADPGQTAHDLVRDMIELVTSVSATAQEVAA